MLFFFKNGSQAVTEELIIVYRLDIRAGFSPIDTGPPGAKAHPTLINEAVCAMQP